MFTVTGTLAGIGYQVGVHPQPIPDGDAGCVMGSSNALDILRLNVGVEVQASPVSESVVLDLGKPDTVLAGLHALTTVTRVDGDDVPNVHGEPLVPGRVH